jgi:hypothetical protein
MGEKIIISFDDEKPEKPEEKITIDFKSTSKEKPESKIQNSKVSTYFHGNPELTGFEQGELKYPEGLENGFRKIFSLKLNDTFFNSILLNNKFAIITSVEGKIYFIDRFAGSVVSKIDLTDESFEKTGIVINNTVYVNSVRTIFSFENNGDEIKERKLFTAENDFYVWSNINKSGKGIIFLEYSPMRKNVKLMRTGIPEEGEAKVCTCGEFSIKHYLYDSVISYKNFIFTFYDNKISKYNSENSTFTEYELKFDIDSDTNFILLDGKIYFNNKNNELFYFDIANEDIRFSGIKCPYINSLGGFGDNIFAGTLNGWYLYKSTGVLVFSYDDINGNKIESVNKNILAVSNGNKIIFHNLRKFHEAEGFSLAQSITESETDKIVSARISEDLIFVLTKSGLFEGFNNDKLNLFV